MKSWAGSLCLLLWVICLLSSNAYPQENSWLHYEPEIVTLRGKLTTIINYGAPGYGETPEKDDVEESIILVLPLPIRVKDDPNSRLNSPIIANITHVQLVIYTGVARGYSQYFNREVEVTGTLFKSFTGHHHTDVLLTVNTLRPVGTSSNKAPNETLTPAKKWRPTVWVPHAPRIAQLEGTLTKVIKYGAPNYGDPATDKKLDVPIIVLPWAADVDQTRAGVTYIQLILPLNIGRRYRQYFDRTVSVTGTLSEASGKEHFTDVVMEVKTIDAFPTKQ